MSGDNFLVMEYKPPVLIEKFPGVKKTAPNNKQGFKYTYKAKYMCFCGNEFITLFDSFKRCKAKSCGCLLIKPKKSQEEIRIKRIYAKIKSRCYDKNNDHYSYYGEKGITMCEEWKNNFSTFLNWALYNGYESHLTVDRKNNDLGYSPDNCRWASRRIQAINTAGKGAVSGFTGVSKIGRKFNAHITIDYKLIYLGTFNTPEEASEVYQKAKKERDSLYLKQEGL